MLRTIFALCLLGACRAVPAVESWMVADGFLVDGGRELAEAAKRKFCNVTNLPGDYRYEACGEFCKEPKATNHCRYCKCRSCSFCQAKVHEMAPKIHEAKKAKKAKRSAKKEAAAGGASEHTVTVKVETAAAAGGTKRLRKGGGKGKKGAPSEPAL